MLHGSRITTRSLGKDAGVPHSLKEIGVLNCESATYKKNRRSPASSEGGGPSTSCMWLTISSIVKDLRLSSNSWKFRQNFSSRMSAVKLAYASFRARKN